MTLPIIFDCDTGIDDALAMLYGAGNGADFIACTVTHGNVPVTTGAHNTLTVLDYLGLDTVPVFEGAARPLAQPLMTAEFVHGEDGLGDAGVRQSTRVVAGDMAAAEIVRLARSRPGELTLVAVGPLTNIGIALLLDPGLADLIKEVVIMGGAVGVPGNASEFGEANVWHDPEAAQLVVDAPWDVLFVGLEITMKTGLSGESIERISASKNHRAQLAWKIIQFYMDAYEAQLGERTCVLHDPLAMALALDPSLATYRTIQASVELRGERSRGQLVGDLRGYNRAALDAKTPGVIRIVESLDISKFHENFLSALGA
jgi:purine nucleosidase